MSIMALVVSVVLETVDARQFAVAKPFIEALTIVKERLNVPVHFIHTSGPRCSLVMSEVDQSTFLKDDGDVYATMARLDTRHPVMKQNNQIIDFAENNGVRSYIVAPPMVYGPGTGFGNKVSIQIVALIWPLMHIDDQVTLYVYCSFQPPPPPGSLRQEWDILFRKWYLRLEKPFSRCNQCSAEIGTVSVLFIAPSRY
ncbi:hypothetical protein DFH05DRAFT_548017 [Lentinula detonsa]|uniref:Macro domain-containing protein n=1 Tax=Lentinula detonsa TaxID=2804962 RepID=A0A9W8TTI6_9AGAR|nr:hypothetical protein DFH05DRAFT_548017 [Lentinula detonsa]